MIDQKNPFGLHTVTPYLMVSDAERLLQFLQHVFDAKLRGDISYRADDTVEHSEIMIGDSIIMMAEPSPQFPEIKPTSCGMYVYVNDCDKVYEKALKKGGLSISVPTDYPHGDRYGGVKDFAGNIWWIVTHNKK
ncbi:VOC family protein [Lutimonas sp.]|uniref:VOC family protein n=1 Tax=Lutimonas sp. TaxID=1872403 RepID=UPI003D9B8177